MSNRPHEPSDVWDKQVFAWATVVPTLVGHFSVTDHVNGDVVACGCSSDVYRNKRQWASHVGDVIARSLATATE